MHRCLQIREILLEVLELVFASKNPYPDLVGLARTCRSFHGPALELLWREQPSLLRLVMCFPREILDFSEPRGCGYDSGTVKFTKTPSVQDWERPLVYAKHIKRVVNSVPAYMLRYELHASVLQTLLESCPSTPLLPNLRCLNYVVITGNSNAFVASLFTLFSPNLLQSLTFRCYYRLDSHDSHTFLTHLPNRCPQIENLSFSLLARPSADIIEYITRFASLRHLKSLDFAVAKHSESDCYIRPSSINPPNSFPSLVNLTVDCPYAVVVLHILKAIHSTKLRDIKLRCPCESDTANLREVFAIVASHPAWEESMRSILLTTGACSITVDDVRRLLTFNHLRRVDLDSIGLVPDDHLLDEMAKAWPMLEHLSITSSRSRTPSKATLNGLVPFSKYCPHIATLRLQLDASRVPVPANTTDASRDAPHEGERRGLLMYVEAPSEIRDPTGVASFLLNLFPRIALSIPAHQADSLQEFLWRRVVTIMVETRR
ncbi:hypothetical protein PAXINDRAFT_19529 [Paxillus involutus ATCC 200175]|uniref:F-box domain-containing protein n=1 Tax=Paxillus involutus ATCC 200175 TaxID=664439 RepID=A0A0C9SN43_PAXIN|nr:hypothetical protein PAXINDRAFT_19529 [Paxillus involutus ATCC 200175]